MRGLTLHPEAGPAATHPMNRSAPRADTSLDMPRRESGQAAVESALVLPLAVFLFLGTLQLFLLQQSRLMAQYGAFQAARVGSVNQGACSAMTEAALLSVLPSIHSFLGDQTLSGSAAQRLASAFTRVQENHYGGFEWGTWLSPGQTTEAIVWLIREGRAPTIEDVVAYDQPLEGREPFRLELRMIYWAPLRIPFADWMYARIAASQLGIASYTGVDPLMPVRPSANWTERGATLEGRVASELGRRTAAGHFVFPIEVSSTIRMMTPPRLSEFDQPACPAPGLRT